MKVLIRVLMVAAVAVAGAIGAGAQDDTISVLLLTKSSGFEHGCIKEEDGKPGHVQTVMNQLAATTGVELTSTKDASLVNGENLKNYDLVIFYTTGDLTKAGGDGHPPMTKENVDELFDWIKAGGGFMGFHCATDTFGDHWKKGEDDQPYIEMVGGHFAGHGRQFEGIVKVVDPSHAAIQGIPDGWVSNDEWYVFKKLNTKDMRVLALMDPGAEREKQDMYDIAPYPVVWCSAYGDGRVYYNAMGHREDVWDKPEFQQSVISAATWAMGQADGSTEPNYDEVVKE